MKKSKNNKSFSLRVIQYININRLEFRLDSLSLKEIKIKPRFQISKTFINYPFGIEETKRQSIQSLDFLWIQNGKYGMIFSQKNSQQFKINRQKNIFKNLITKDGLYEFSISYGNFMNFYEVYYYHNSYMNSFYGVRLSENADTNTFSDKKGISFLSVNKPLCISNFWRRNKTLFVRIFNPNESSSMCHLTMPFIDGKIIELSFNHHEIKVIKSKTCEFKPWEIKLFKITLESG